MGTTAAQSRRRGHHNRPVVDLVDGFLVSIASAKPSRHTLAAYRRDVLGISRRIAVGLGVGLEDLGLRDLTKSALRRAFASWASDHAKASILRAWSAWNAFWSYLVSEDLAEGNPMDGIAKPKRPRAPVKVIRGGDAIQRLLAAAAVPDPSARSPWPERDLALTATFAVTGLRLAEALGLSIGSFDGPAGERRITVVGKGDKARAIPIYPQLEQLIDRYLRSRAERFPDHRLDHPATPLFVDSRGRPLSRRQVQYRIERLYVRAGIRAHVPAGALVHALRHTFATSALQGGANVLEVQQLLGHESLDTTKRYLEATANELRDAIKAHPAQVTLRNLVG
ncbi:MAG: tyrosine-type recombinase/integrase [Actinomycetota bacterium]